MDVFRNVAPVRYKNRMELQYWIGRHEQEGQLSGPHYEHFYTSFFGLDRRALPGGCAIRHDHNVYQSLRDDKPHEPGEEGIVSARLVRV